MKEILDSWVQVDKMSAHDPMQKEMATQKKEERKAEAEWNKLEAHEQNAAARQAAKVGGHASYTTGETGGGAYGTEPLAHPHSASATGTPGYPTGTQQMSAVPGHGTSQPYGGQVDPTGVRRTHPTGLPGDTTGHNTRV